MTNITKHMMKDNRRPLLSDMPAKMDGAIPWAISENQLVCVRRQRGVEVKVRQTMYVVMDMFIMAGDMWSLADRTFRTG